jgi:hypothetical protein
MYLSAQSAQWHTLDADRNRRRRFATGGRNL